MSKARIAGQDSLRPRSAPQGLRSVPRIHEELRSPGQPLDPTMRGFMEPRFGHDFSRVRVHSDARAAESAESVNALAYTGGLHIVFGKGRYEPTSREGRRLLAHELTHVVQQRAGVHLEDGAGEPNDTYERHADEVARKVVGGHSAGSLLSAYQSAPHADRASGTFIQRQGAEHGFADVYKAVPDATYVAGHSPKDVENFLRARTSKLVDVDVEDFGDMLSAAREGKTGTMHIVGSGLDYFKNHPVTEGIRQKFISMIHGRVRSSKRNSGKITGTFQDSMLAVYGGTMWDFSAENLFSKGTWMIGKNDRPTIDYELSYSRIALEAWSVDWKATWKIRDNFDLKGGTDQTSFYNLVAKPAGWLWHDVLGGKSPAPVNIDWSESGKLQVGPPVKATGTKIRSLHPGDVRQW